VKTPHRIGIACIVAGIILFIAGGATWAVVKSELKAEHITVSADANHFGGRQVQGPFTAYAQAEVIQKHALEASGGKTYAQLDQNDPTRQTVMTASFLRASLFTSVVAFGVAALVLGLGVLFVLVGWALIALSARQAPAAPDAPAAPAAGEASKDEPALV
jgi:hypothetical protein